MTIPSHQPNPASFISANGTLHYLTGNRAGHYIEALCLRWLNRECAVAQKAECKKCAVVMNLIRERK